MDSKRISEVVLARLAEAEDHPFTRQLYAEVAEECGVKWHEVQKAVDYLQRKGLVRKYKRHGDGNHYRLKPTRAKSAQPLTAHPSRGAQPRTALVEGLDLRSVEDKKLKNKLYRDLKGETTGKAGALTLVDGHLVERAREEPDWDGARAWIDGRDKVATGEVGDLWREFGVPTEWVREELRRLGFIPRMKGIQVLDYHRDRAKIRELALKHLRNATRIMKEAGYNCAQAQDLIEEVWD